MKKYTKKYDILDTGTIVLVKDDTIYFQLADNLKVFISFLDKGEIQEQKMEFNFISNKELEIQLINFNNSLSTGNVEPLQLATLNNKKVYLNFSVTSLNNTKTINYTWYQEK